MKRICVFCGSHAGKSEIYTQTAQGIGKELALKNVSLVYGGGSVGLMGIVADSCLKHGGEVIGIIPEYLTQIETPHQNLNQLIVVENMFERKSEMDRISDGFIVLPGGYGTLDELFEMVTLFQLKQHTKPIIICNVNQFFNPIFNQIKQCVDQGFISNKFESIVIWADSVTETFEKLDHFNW